MIQIANANEVEYCVFHNLKETDAIGRTKKIAWIYAKKMHSNLRHLAVENGNMAPRQLSVRASRIEKPALQDNDLVEPFDAAF